MTTDTVEWGSERGRAGGLPRWVRTVPPRHTTAVAAGLAALGFALVLTGELLPWLEVTPPASASSQVDFPGQFDTTLRLTQLVVWQAPAYYTGVTALLACLALALSGRPRARRGAGAAGIGVAAGQAVMLAGLYVTIQDGDDISGIVSRIPDGMADFGTGEGFYSAALGLLLLAAAAALAGWGGARPAGAAPAAVPVAAGAGAEASTAGPDEAASEPLDLTVAPADPFRKFD